MLLAGVSNSGASLDRALRLEDLGVRVTKVEEPDGSTMLAVDTESGIVNDALEKAARRAGERLGLRPLPVFTYLANSIRKGRRAGSVLARHGDGPCDSPGVEHLPDESESGTDPVVLNEWTARELAAVPGDRVELDYYLWDSVAGLQTRSVAFTVSGVVPIAGMAADRRLVPEYPGITGAENLSDWDPPFPIDLSRVRPVDEALLAPVQDDAEGLRPLRTGPRSVAVAIRRAHVAALLPRRPLEG